jgi:hypothetical protein
MKRRLGDGKGFGSRGNSTRFLGVALSQRVSAAVLRRVLHSSSCVAAQHSSRSNIQNMPQSGVLFAFPLGNLLHLMLRQCMYAKAMYVC